MGHAPVGGSELTTKAATPQGGSSEFMPSFCVLAGWVIKSTADAFCLVQQAASLVLLL
jgi:hypothetical protein